MPNLHGVLKDRRQEILERWTVAIGRVAGGVPVTPSELVDHLPQFLDEVIDVLFEADARTAATGRTSTAARHGIQRFRIGFDLDAVVREYAILHRSIIEFAHKDGVRMELDEQLVLVECIYSGIADAVTQYSRQRDAELQRQANEHFAFVAHELRNPLSSAQLAFQSLNAKGLMPATPLLEVLSNGLGRARDLIEGTLSLSIAGGAVELDIERFDLGAVVAEAIGESSLAAKDKSITLHADSRDTIEIQGDRRLIYSALANLVNNAVKFTHPGGKVHVAWRVVGESAVIDVGDECGGLPAGAVDKMFEAFVQVGKDRSGFGLGLAIARQAVDAHGGAITVHNREGDGCTLSIELPLVARTPADPR
jgi:signal transduction histidine kinase